MSEYINNSARRKELIKEILRQLNSGEQVDEMRSKYSDVLAQFTSQEIVEVEQMLIDEGMPVEEVMRLCDVHVSVYRDSLDQQPSPESLPGHPVHTMRAENDAAAHLLDELHAAVGEVVKAPTESALSKARGLVERLHAFERHYLRKENLLFPYLEKYKFSGPSTVMWGIHDEARSDWKALLALLQSGPGNDTVTFTFKLNTLFNKLETNIREMFYKEDKILFPAALERLSEDDWSTLRVHEDEFGYFEVQPGNQWQPKLIQAVRSPAAQPAPAQPVPAAALQPATSGGADLPLKVGAMTLEQIQMMLTHLPVDITFVDENDTVRFYSETPERIFKRTPAIIGRKVEKCHPPNSVDKVVRIVADFRAGRRDTAEFWIQMGGKFIHIQYYAVHDERGAYRGTLEVSQDLTHLREIQGEKRLLDD